MKLHGIAFRLASLTLAFTLLLFAVIIGYNYILSRSIILNLAEEKGRLLANSTAKEISSVLDTVQKVTNAIAFSLEEKDLSKEKLDSIGQRILIENPELSGSSIAFEPFLFKKTTKNFVVFYRRTAGRISSTYLEENNSQYFYEDWYQLAKELKHPIWTKPYVDEERNMELKVSYSMPFYREEGRRKTLLGIISVDLSLSWLQKLLSQINKQELEYTFLLSQYGTYIIHPDTDLVMNDTIFTYAENNNLPQLREAGHKILSQEIGLIEIEDLPRTEDSLLYFSSLPGQSWSVVVVFPKTALLAEIFHLNKVMLLIGGGGLVALTLLIVFLSNRITHPLRKLTLSANAIASGDLEVNLPEVTSHDEINELTTSFLIMRRNIKKHIKELAETTAVKERIESELRIAREIQMSTLPRQFPAFPNREEFGIFASIEPAKEVGGDLYDFFFVDSKRLCFLIGDVAGKGVPAAFFMARTKALIKIITKQTINPGEVLSVANNDLTENNDSCMFVTLFLAIIHLDTGEVRYANAGHNSPLLLSADKNVTKIPSPNELVCGCMKDFTYTTRTLTMAPGNTIFLYTDGVTEAMNDEQRLFSENLLIKVINECRGHSTKQIIRTVDDSLKNFIGDAKQSDDITMLSMQYLGIDKK